MRFKNKKILLLVLLSLVLLGSALVAPKTAQAAKKTKYTITYKANGGRKAPKKQTKSSKKAKLKLTITKSKPTKSGYAFAGWNTRKNGTGKTYKPGKSVTLTKKKNKLTLYAQWTKKTTTSAAGSSNTSTGSTSNAQVVANNSGSGTSTSKSDDSSDIEDSQTNGNPGKLEVHFIDVGQGDATLITCNNEAMLIDAGDNTNGTAVQSYLTSKGITKLKYAIGTHPDADHIGGLDVIITKFDVENLFMPKTSKDTKTYKDVISAAEYKNLKIVSPKSGTTFKIGTAEFQIVSTDKDYGTSANDWSICIRMTHGTNSFLFVGDAEETAELDMLNTGLTLKSDVYKVAHHGSKTGSVPEFMDVVKPTYAVISCAEGNDYGHPHAAVLNTLRSMGIKVFRTDEQGTIQATSDGKTIKWNMSPSDSWRQGEMKGTTSDSETHAYVLNTSTGIFHLPTCQYAEKMSERNKKEMATTRDNMINGGYAPCGSCKP